MLPQRQKEKYFLKVGNEEWNEWKTARETWENSERYKQAGRREVEVRSECSEQRIESVEMKEEQIRSKGKLKMVQTWWERKAKSKEK